MFQTEGGGLIPTSPLQLEVDYMAMNTALILNELWHSRLPKITNYWNCKAFGAYYENMYYAVALWGPPIATIFNNKNYYELRRMAIASDAPKNTGSRMLKIMRLIIKKQRPDIVKLISYQDTDVHKGTIYKADNWKLGAYNKSRADSWIHRKNRLVKQATGDKIRWEYDL